jgi:hypothetical protein
MSLVGMLDIYDIALAGASTIFCPTFDATSETFSTIGSTTSVAFLYKGCDVTFYIS